MVERDKNSIIDFYNADEIEDENKTSQFGQLVTDIKLSQGLSNIPTDRIGLTVCI